MSLETTVADLVRASNALTGEVAGKQAAIDAKVAAKVAEMDVWRSEARAEYPVINTFANNLLWSGVAAGAEDGTVGIRGTLPAGFYAWVANAEGVIQGTRAFVGNENGLPLPYYCPSPTVLRMKFIPRPGANPGDGGGRPLVPLPLAWGYPQPIAGRHVTHACYARLVSGAQSVAISDGQVIDATWRRLVGRQSGNDSHRAHWSPTLSDFTTALELEFIFPHTYLGWVPDESLPVYAKAVQIL